MFVGRSHFREDSIEAAVSVPGLSAIPLDPLRHQVEYLGLIVIADRFCPHSARGFGEATTRYPTAMWRTMIELTTPTLHRGQP